MEYALFSRKQGYTNGFPIRFFKTSLIVDENNETERFVNNSGQEILNKLSNSNISLSIKEQLREICKVYYDWYYYPSNTIILCQLID
jgi:hypothetical protein